MKGSTRRIRRKGKGNQTKKFGGAQSRSKPAILSRILKTAKSFKNRARNTLARQKNQRFLKATEKRLKKFGKSVLPKSQRMEVIEAIPESTHRMSTRRAAAAAAAAATEANHKAAAANEALLKMLTMLDIK